MRTARCPASSGWRSRRPATCATARTRTSEVRCTRRSAGPGVLGGANVLQGKEMSFNNWLDVDAAYALGVGASRERGGDREAQQPVRCGVGRHTCRGVRESVRVRQGVGVRGDRGVPRPVRRACGRRDGRRVHRGRGRSVVHGRCADGVRCPTEPARRASADRDRRRVGRATDPGRRARAGSRPGDRDAAGVEGRLVARADRAGVGTTSRSRGPWRGG